MITIDSLSLGQMVVPVKLVVPAQWVVPAELVVPAQLVIPAQWVAFWPLYALRTFGLFREEN